ncbi:MAG: hypothetical protein Q7V01_12360 [Vicinamibacterales bacterium]|nr:hypothetical protein [Vicinamibacterales bacterium]
MKRAGRLGLTVVVFGVAGLICGSASGEETSARARVDVSIIGTQRTGATGPPSATAGDNLAVRQTETFGLYARDGSLGAGPWPDLRQSSEGSAWRVTVRLVSLQVDTVELAITWGRHRASAGSWSPEAGDSRTVSLRAGERHVLDLVQIDTPTSSLANVLVELEVRRVEDPAYADLSIGYDLWLVHEGRGGRRTTRRVQLNDGQGATLPFAFEPVGFGLDGRVRARVDGASLALSVDGQAMGRLRPDGAFDVAITSWLWLRCGKGGRGGRGGTKTFTARDGEAVGVELPVGTGYCGIPDVPLPPDARNGVTAEGASLRISNEAFFEGERLSLLVTVGRVR